MRTETFQCDVTVIGGGLAGVCAAVAAARLGQKVALVQNRPVLGGNSSSEVRVWVCGATAHGNNRYARETGIMGEMFVENQYRNPDGNPYLWDLVVLETVLAESNITLFLNTDVHEAEAEGPAEDRKILSVTGWMAGSERKITFKSPMYIDCTGDGLVGFLAGAGFKIGREAKSEYNEDWAPEVPDGITLGSTILFYTKDVGHPVKFVAPSFARDIENTTIPMRRVIRSGSNGCDYWWIEFGGELDTVHDNERIRDELWAVVYGIWDYIKNSGKFEDAANMTLEWVGAVPGKREYRRFIGDYTLNQNDIMAQEPFEDRVAFGGWSIDLHPPQGVYATESGSKHLHADGNYHIPFRSLYSSNVNNMMFAGRNISASHVAFGTTRVMATCAVIGEAAGSGAALCVQNSVTPRELHAGHLTELQQTMLRQDASIIGLASRDEKDLALGAKVTASSTYRSIAVEQSAGSHVLERSAGILFPVDPALEGVELLVDVDAATTLTVELWDTGRGENYVPANQVQSVDINLQPGEKQWVNVPLEWQPQQAQNAFVIVRKNTSVSLHAGNKNLSGVLAFNQTFVPAVAVELEDRSPEKLIHQWSMNGVRRSPWCFRAKGVSQAYAPGKAVGGYIRPYGGPNQWMSEELSGSPQWLELSWDAPQAISEVHVTFNDDVNEDLINLHHHRTDFEIIPELAKKYVIEGSNGGDWTLIAEESDNRKRKHVYRLAEKTSLSRLRLTVLETNGSSFAELIEIRAYE
ncbi:FAD-dependent oxidoreductase [Paenibacillus pasadenensis]|uniref:FAD-dependent oxidoreductase n=1 Tax=Paenibacillus pasadenensis TaxID=217090 RepID=UPI00203CA63D|nr:FAD-dependent oxidoreductase [Paenibacillus pasadenensis]